MNYKYFARIGKVLKQIKPEVMYILINYKSTFVCIN